ncbi:MAG: extracellular solute-binding protein [Cellulosilyticaceae bacterium]
MKNHLLKFSKGITVATVMALTISGCTTQPEKKVENSSTNSSVSKDGSIATENKVSVEKGLEAYPETVTVTMFAAVDPTMNFNQGESFENNLWSKLYKDELNIEIDYKWIVNNDQYNQKLNVAIASKDFADIMSFGVGDKNMKIMYEAGYLQDLTGVYDEYVTDYTKQLLEADGGTAVESGKFEGKMYGIPNTNASVEQTGVMWIRKDWLEKSGKSAPTTMEELYELAKIFKEADYDGVGTVYGISVDKGSESNAVGSVLSIFSGFKAYPNKWIEGSDGSIVYGSIQPEVKETLGYLAKMYSDGLIDREYGVKDGGKVGEDACAGKIGIYLGGHASPLWPLNATIKEDADWIPYPIPTVDGSDPVQVVGIAAQSYYVATKDAKNPEAILKLMNLFTKTCFSDEGNALYFTTSEQYREPFKHARIQAWPTTKNIDIYKRINEFRQTGNEEILKANQETYDMFQFIKTYEETGVRQGGWDYARVFDVGGAEEVLAGYVDKGNILYDGFYGTPTNTMASKMATLNKLEAQTFAQIIIGASPLDEFDKFVEEWNKLGGEKITKEVNEWKQSR